MLVSWNVTLTAVAFTIANCGACTVAIGFPRNHRTFHERKSMKQYNVQYFCNICMIS